MHDILLRVQTYLDRANAGEADISDELLDEFAALCRHALARQLRARKEPFTLRMSNLGRPVCQLQMERDGAPAEAVSYAAKMRNLLGDLVEASATVIMKAAGVNVQATQQAVSLEIGGATISGTLDVIIDDEVWDIKSASTWSFENKFQAGFDQLQETDTFGYVEQGFGYAQASGKRFGGWIVVDKATGEWTITTTPDDAAVYNRAHRSALDRAGSNVRRVVAGEGFNRQYDDEPEIFKKVETGNRILNVACSFCPFKWSCWPGLQHKPVPMSRAINPPWRYYTVLAEDGADTGIG